MSVHLSVLRCFGPDPNLSSAHFQIFSLHSKTLLVKIIISRFMSKIPCRTITTPFMTTHSSSWTWWGRRGGGRSGRRKRQRKLQKRLGCKQGLTPGQIGCLRERKTDSWICNETDPPDMSVCGLANIDFLLYYWLGFSPLAEMGRSLAK